MFKNIFLLEDYLEFITYGFTNPMPDSDTGPWKVTAKDIVNGKINFTTARKTTQVAYEQKLTNKSRPKVDDILDLLRKLVNVEPIDNSCNQIGSQTETSSSVTVTFR